METGDKTQKTKPAGSGPTPAERISPANSQTEVIAGRSQHLGNYEILSELARGGMGVVYRARDLRLNREVALKTIRNASLASSSDLERFKIEVEASALLDHPNIVPVYETGESGGVRYLAMRLVEGGNLLQRLEDYRTPKAAAQLVYQIAQAVDYAHQRGVLHRDLKPANILLDERGQPLVSDFGLAKLRDAKSDLTLTGNILGTPQYMAPEQAGGKSKQVTTAADVYSLGAVLFHLLTGRPPFDGTTPLEVARKVLQEEPPRPSAIVPAIDQDLETICLKCLEKNPAARYSSPSALAADLQRWIKHEPISARPISSTQRIAKWVRRNPVVAALAMGVVSVAAIGFLATYWQLQVANKAKGEAETRAASETKLRLRSEIAERTAREETAASKALNSLLLEDILDRASPYKESNRELKLVDALRSASTNIDNRFSGLPKVAGELHYTLGNAFLGLTEYELAIQHLESSAKLFSQANGSNDVKAAIAKLDLARVYRMTGRLKEATALHREIQPILDAKDPQAAWNSRYNMATVKSGLGQIDEAEAVYRSVLPANFETEGITGHNFLAASDLGEIWMRRGKYVESEKLLKRTLEVANQTVGEKGFYALLTRQRVGYVQLMAGRLEEAEATLRSTLALSREALGEAHHATLTTTYSLAITLRKRGQLQEALEVIHKTTELREQHFGLLQKPTLNAFWEEAEILRQLKRPEEATAIRIKILPSYETVYGRDAKPTKDLRKYIAFFWQNQALAAVKTNGYLFAETNLLQSYKLYCDNLEDGRGDTERVAKLLAENYTRQGQKEAAEEWSRKAQPVQAK